MTPANQDEAVLQFTKYIMWLSGASLLMLLAASVLFVGEPDLVDAMIYHLMK